MFCPVFFFFTTECLIITSHFTRCLDADKQMVKDVDVISDLKK